MLEVVIWVEWVEWRDGEIVGLVVLMVDGDVWGVWE